MPFAQFVVNVLMAGFAAMYAILGTTRTVQIPYTRVNKRTRLFSKLQGNMPLIAKGKIDHTSKTAMPSLVARVFDSK